MIENGQNNQQLTEIKQFCLIWLSVISQQFAVDSQLMIYSVLFTACCSLSTVIICCLKIYFMLFEKGEEE